VIPDVTEIPGSGVIEQSESGTGFSEQLYYQIRENTLLIVGIMHLSRDYSNDNFSIPDSEYSLQ